MGKKKSKKTSQKPVEVPPSPKSEPTSLAEAEEPISESLPLAPEAPAPDSTPEEPSQPTSTSPDVQVHESVNGPTSEPATQDLDAVEPPSSEDQGLVNGSSPKEEDSTEPIADASPIPPSQDGTSEHVESNQDQTTELEPELAVETQLDADVKAEPTEQAVEAPLAEPTEPTESTESTESTEPTEPLGAPAEAPVDTTVTEAEESHVELPVAPEVPEAARVAEIPEASEPQTAPELEPTPVPAEQHLEEATAVDSSNDAADTATPTSDPSPAESEQPTVSDATPQVSTDESEPEAAVETSAGILADRLNDEGEHSTFGMFRFRD
jgi:nuclear polyadenylated RNA-binding protein 3